MRDRDFVWDGTFGSARCPSCEATPYLWFTDEGGEFRFGCRERCARHEILEAIGLSGYDVVRAAPKWLRKR